MDRATFFQQLRRSRLLSEQSIDEALTRAPDCDRAGVVARALVREGLLTRYQARQLLAGRANRLTLGPYRILDVLGRGATGGVYKALHGMMNRVVALKIISRRMLKEDRAVDFFRREVRAAAQLDHPNIVTAYDANEVKGIHYLAMECIEGPSLQGLVKERGPLPVGLACELLRQAAEALQYAHEKGIVHRDIKPANLLIAQLPGLPAEEGPPANQAGPETAVKAPVVKIADFGLARLHCAGRGGVQETIMVDPGVVWGTIDYISPEQANDVHDVDIRSDLYSLGCTLFYALTGQVPFPGHTAMEKLLKHLTLEPRPLGALRPDAPAGVAAIVQRLMAKDRGQRFQTPAELAQELAPWCGPDTSQATPAELAQELAPWCGPGTSQAEDAAPPDPALTASAGDQVWVPEASLSEAPVAADGTDDQLSPFELEPAPIDATVRDKWRQWTAIVEVSVRRRGSRRWINSEAFQVLQKELVEVCQEQARASEGRRHKLFRGLEELVKPWLKPETLMQTDPEIHYSLLGLCRQAELEIDKWVAVSDKTTKEGQTLFGGIFARFKGRKQRSEFEEVMRRIFGMEL